MLRYRFLFEQMVRRELRQKYKGSALGVLWYVINPLVLMGAYWLMFGKLLPGVSEPDYPLFLMVGLIVWLFFAPFVRWRTTHFIVTTDRLMAREGVIKRTGIDIPLGRINSVQFEHGLLDRVFGCGTLIIESASDEPLRFDDIPKVERVHTIIYREVNDNPYDDYQRGRQPRQQETQQGLPPQQPPPTRRGRR